MDRLDVFFSSSLVSGDAHTDDVSIASSDDGAVSHPILKKKLNA